MLRNNLYYIAQSNQDGYIIRFDETHPIFVGHFPEHPIVPGACLVQIAEELASLLCGHPMRFTTICNLRFNQPITPNQEVTITILHPKEKTFTFQFSVFDSICAHFSVLNERLYK